MGLLNSRSSQTLIRGTLQVSSWIADCQMLIESGFSLLTSVETRPMAGFTKTWGITMTDHVQYTIEIIDGPEAVAANLRVLRTSEKWSY